MVSFYTVASSLFSSSWFDLVCVDIVHRWMFLEQMENWRYDVKF